MANKWEKIKLGECTTWSSGGTPSKSNPSYWGGDIPWISASSMHSTRIYDSDERITALGSQNGTRKAQAGDILLLVRGSGLHKRIPVGKAMRDLAFNQDVKALTPDNKNITSDYLLYWFLSKESYLLTKVELTGIGAGKLDTNSMQNLVIQLPDIEYQEKITGILSAFDDKIELNRQMNRTLEQMARALFKSWFIDFDPVHAKQRGEQPAGMDAETAALIPDRFVEIDGKEVPEGWKVKALDSVADFLNGLALQKYPPTGENDLPIIKIAQLRKGNTEGSGFAGRNVGSKYTVQDGDVLFSWSGSLEVVRWSGGEGALNQHLFKVTSSIQPAWFVYYWLLEHLPHFREIAANKATTMGHIQRGHLTDAKVYVPEKNLLDALGRQMQPVFEQIFENDLEARRLAELRDSLLPRLLSGELDVSDWENAVEAPEGAPA